MKSFAISFFFTMMVCLAIWSALRVIAVNAVRTVESADTNPADLWENPQTGGEAAPDVATLIRVLEQSRAGEEVGKPLDAGHWAALDAIPGEELEAWVRQRQPDARDALWLAGVLVWAKHDPMAALDFAMALQAAHPATGDCACCGEPGGQYDDLPFEIHAVWLRSDPAAALAHGLPKIARPEFLEIAAEARDTLVQTDFPRALDELASGLPQPEDGISDFTWTVIGNRRSIATDFIGRQLENPARKAEFVRWLAAQPDLYAAVGVFSRIYSRARHEESWLHPDRLPDFFPARDQLPEDFGDLETAIWMGCLAFGENPLRFLPHATLILRPSVAAWAYIDPASAGDWLLLQEGGEHFTSAIVGYIRGIRANDPEAAVRWADRIPDPRMRLGNLVDGFPEWRLRDSEAADEWLASSDLPDSIRDFLRVR